MANPFASRKFIYALTGVIVALVLALLPSVVDLEPETVTMIEDVLPQLILVILLVIGGHTLSDAIHTAKTNPVEQADLVDTVHSLIDEVAALLGIDADDLAPPQEYKSSDEPADATH